MLFLDVSQFVFLLDVVRLHICQYRSMMCPEPVGELSLRRTSGYTKLNQSNYLNVKVFLVRTAYGITVVVQ